MINSILDELKNKNIAILGFGLEGKSTYSIFSSIVILAMLDFPLFLS